MPGRRRNVTFRAQLLRMARLPRRRCPDARHAPPRRSGTRGVGRDPGPGIESRVDVQERQVRGAPRPRRNDPPRAGTAPALSRLADRHLPRDARRDRDEPRRSVAAEDRARQRRRAPPDATLGHADGRPRCHGSQDGPRRAGGCDDHRDRTAPERGELHRQLLHRERGPVRRQRPAHAGLSPPRPALARLLRQPADRKPARRRSRPTSRRSRTSPPGRRSGSSSTS